MLYCIALYCIVCVGETEKVWRLQLHDDSRYEGEETFKVRLTDVVMTTTELPDVAIVTITDEEDGMLFLHISCKIITVELFTVKHWTNFVPKFETRSSQVEVCIGVNSTAFGRKFTLF